MSFLDIINQNCLFNPDDIELFKVSSSKTESQRLDDFDSVKTDRLLKPLHFFNSKKRSDDNIKSYSRENVVSIISDANSNTFDSNSEDIRHSSSDSEPSDTDFINKAVKKNLKRDRNHFEKNHMKSDNNLASNDKDIELFQFKKRRKSCQAIDQTAKNHVKTRLKFEEMINNLRHQKRIKVDGSDIPALFCQFGELISRFSMGDFITKNITKLGYIEPTPIQMQSIPILLQGRDLFGVAPTGSGKTAAFVIPLISVLRKIKSDKNTIRALILAPTRELVQQIYKDTLDLSSGSGIGIFMLTGSLKSSFEDNSKKSRNVLVSTPLRLLTHIKSGGIDLSKVQILVIDESDRLLDISTERKVSKPKQTKQTVTEQVDGILAECSNSHLQRVMFSATLPDHIEQLARTVLRDPVRIIVGKRGSATQTVNQKLLFVGTDESKMFTIRQLISQGLKPPILVFVQSKSRAEQLFKGLQHESIQVGLITSNCTKKERDLVLRNFRSGKVWMLICTDLMSRGMDFKDVTLVINFDFPPSVVEYIHRIGRTGRAGKTGEAITFFTDSDRSLLRSIAETIKQSGGHVPQWILNMKKISRSRRKELKTKPPKRKLISRETMNQDTLEYKTPEIGNPIDDFDESDDIDHEITSSRSKKSKNKRGSRRIWSKTRRDRWRRHKGGNQSHNETNEISVVSLKNKK